MTTAARLNSIHRVRLLHADNAEDARLWNCLVDSASLPDVYYRPGYAYAYQVIGKGKAVAVLAETCGVRALFPLLLRPLNTLRFAPEEPGFDAATPYGYGGLLLLDGVEHFGTQQGRELVEVFRDWCCQHQIVSAYIRLHPVMHQHQWFEGAVNDHLRLTLLGSTTAINLHLWNSESASIATLNKGRRSDLNFARKSLRVTWTSDGRILHDDLRLFYGLYEQRMTELEAGPDYHFPFDYYRALTQGLGSRLEVAIAWLDGNPVGGALFMIDRVMAHYHLSTTNRLGRTHKAATLILNSAAERARQLDCQRLHLGGGHRGEDLLLAFKQSFGGDLYRYSFLSLICDPLRYSRLLEKRRVTAPHPPALRADFFPEYRA
jgi:Acetyltransferase (GNAT) domain